RRRCGGFLYAGTERVQHLAADVGLVDAGADLGLAPRRGDVFGPVQEFFVTFLAQVQSVRRVLVLLRRETDLVRELLRPGSEQFPGAVKEGAARRRRAGRDEDAVLRLHGERTAEAITHAFGERPPLLVEGVGEFARADADRAGRVAGDGRAGESEPRGGT